MKKHLSIILAIITIWAFCIFYFFQHSKNADQKIDPNLLVAVLMVKNEEKVMVTTLQPLVDAGITQFLIYDTGSTDNTIEITKEFFIKNKIQNFVIEQGPWIDFAASRNQALKLTEEHFPNTTFILMLDAEWILHNGADLLRFCQEQKTKSNAVYMVHMLGAYISMGQARLFRAKSNVFFIRKVHEQPNIPALVNVPKHIYFEYNPTSTGRKKSHERHMRDLNILLQEFKEDPTNQHTVRYIAQTYAALQDYDNSILWYEKLITMPITSPKDLFSAHLYLSMIYHAAKKIDKAILSYLKTYSIRPSRAEPLIRLALLYFDEKEYYLAYLFAKQAVTMPYPTNEIGTIEKGMYDFVRYEMLSLTAHVAGDYKLGEQATIQALKQHPELEYLQKQLQFYQEKLAH